MSKFELNNGQGNDQPSNLCNSDSILEKSNLSKCVNVEKENSIFLDGDINDEEKDDADRLDNSSPNKNSEKEFKYNFQNSQLVLKDIIDQTNKAEQDESNDKYYDTKKDDLDDAYKTQVKYSNKAFELNEDFNYTDTNNKFGLYAHSINELRVIFKDHLNKY
jgi:hypothetical protein